MFFYLLGDFQNTKRLAYDYQIEIELKSDYIHRVNLKMLTDDLERKVSKLESSTESKYKRGLTKLSVQ